MNYDVTDDVIMTSFNRVRLYSYNINPTKFGEIRMINGQVIVLTSSRADFTGNDVTDDVIITKINRVLPYPSRNNSVKFHQDRIRFSRVMLLTRECRQTTDDDDIMMTIPLVLPRGKNRKLTNLTIIHSFWNVFEAF